jgi:hypothetical protein
MRLNRLIDTELPKKTVSNNERLEPKRITPYILKVLPILAKLFNDREEPKCMKLSAEQELPRRARPYILIELPRRL